MVRRRPLQDDLSKKPKFSPLTYADDGDSVSNADLYANIPTGEQDVTEKKVNNLPVNKKLVKKNQNSANADNSMKKRPPKPSLPKREAVVYDYDDIF